MAVVRDKETIDKLLAQWEVCKISHNFPYLVFIVDRPISNITQFLFLLHQPTTNEVKLFDDQVNQIYNYLGTNSLLFSYLSSPIL